MAGNKDRGRNCRRGLKGYTTVFLAVIMSVYVISVVLMIDIASYYSAESIAENVCASVGRSVLSEFQSELFKRYGIFLLRNTESVFEKKADLYLNTSLCSRKGLVRFKLAVADLNMVFYPGRDTYELKRQINKLALGVNEYILAYFSSYTDHLSNTYYSYEVEQIISGKASDEESLLAVKERLIALRFAINMATLNKEDLDISMIGTFVEAVIPGHLDDAAVEVSQALEQAKRDVEQLMMGANIPITGSAEGFGKYKDYLRILLLLVPEDIKFMRMMGVMETNIRMIDRMIFSFSDYVYGFDMDVVLMRRSLSDFLRYSKGTKNVWMHFVYK